MNIEKITPDMNISKIVMNWPELIEIFSLYGLHCFACGVSEFESIGEGARAHGFDEETIGMMIKDANELISKLSQPLDTGTD